MGIRVMRQGFYTLVVLQKIEVNGNCADDGSKKERASIHFEGLIGLCMVRSYISQYFEKLFGEFNRRSLWRKGFKPSQKTAETQSSQILGLKSSQVGFDLVKFDQGGFNLVKFDQGGFNLVKFDQGGFDSKKWTRPIEPFT